MQHRDSGHCNVCAAAADCGLDSCDPVADTPSLIADCRGATGDVWGVQLLVLWPLAYICWCTYFALFRINAFNYNKLIPRTTTGAALMQNGSLMARFAAPTCWNLLHMIHMDGQVTNAAGTLTTTVFTQVRLWDRLSCHCWTTGICTRIAVIAPLGAS